MKEISLNILDVACNSVTANAITVTIIIDYQFAKNLMTVKIIDDGCGMSEEFVKKVLNPFTTTRTTRKVGLGIPLFSESAISTGGTFDIESKLNFGTTVTATYQIDNIDRMPLGEIADTMTTLISLKESVRYVLDYQVDNEKFIFDTNEVKQILGEVSISSLEVLSFLKDYINQGILTTNGGKEVI